LSPSAPAWRAAEKARKTFLQGLKPIRARRFAPGLKPRPPKERNSFRKLPVFAIIFVRDKTSATAGLTGECRRSEDPCGRSTTKQRRRGGWPRRLCKTEFGNWSGLLGFLGGFLVGLLGFLCHADLLPSFSRLLLGHAERVNRGPARCNSYTGARRRCQEISRREPKKMAAVVRKDSPGRHAGRRSLRSAPCCDDGRVGRSCRQDAGATRITQLFGESQQAPTADTSSHTISGIR
jgi:hypothetical protein